jgi:uncharacterized protein DUF5681
VDKLDPGRKAACGKPRRPTQFQPGRSGNPRGRPTAAKDPGSLFHKVMDTTIPVTVNGKQKRVSKLEALFLRLCQEALGGNMQASKQLVELHKRFPRAHQPQSNLTPAEWNEPFEGYDGEVLEEVRGIFIKEQAMRNQKRNRKI